MHRPNRRRHPCVPQLLCRTISLKIWASIGAKDRVTARKSLWGIKATTAWIATGENKFSEKGRSRVAFNNRCRGNKSSSRRRRKLEHERWKRFERNSRLNLNSKSCTSWDPNTYKSIYHASEAFNITFISNQGVKSSRNSSFSCSTSSFSFTMWRSLLVSQLQPPILSFVVRWRSR